MRLLVVSQYFWPEDFRINELVAELSARGHQITVLTGIPNYPAGAAFPAFVADRAQFAKYGDVRVIRTPMFVRAQGKPRLLLNYISFATSATIHALARLRSEQFDAVFVFEASPVTVGLPAVALRALRKWPIAFWVLDQWPETLEAVGVVRSPRVLNAVGSLVRFIYTRCDLILSPSRLLIPLIGRYSRAGQRIEYFPNWAESTYESASVVPAPEVPAGVDTFNVMFAGNIGEAQDFPAILDAAERVKTRSDIRRVRWLIVGDGRMAPWVRAEIVRRGLTDDIIMLGRYPTERMPSFFAHADALLVSLKPEPIFAMTAPGKIQSYLAFGRPVIAMLDGEGASVINDARAGVTGPAGDAAKLADNVAQLAMLSDGERTTMGVNGVEYARREFDRVALLDRLEGWLVDMSNNARAVAMLR